MNLLRASFYFLYLPRRDPHDMDRVADHVGGALFAFRTSGHSCSLMLSGKLGKTSGTVMRIQLFVLAIAASIYCFAQANPPAMAQAGNTGGAVGNRDKSVSGSEVPAKPKSHSHELASRPAADKSKSSGCGNVVGTYKFPFGRVGVFKADGTTTISPVEDRGRWTCGNGQVTVVWHSGYTDHLTPTSSGFSAVNNTGAQFEVVRM
jgi:hypothetical protein